MKARFRVQHQILSGMKYVQVVKRMGISNKMQEMIGSYSPNTTDKPEYEKKCMFHLSSHIHHVTRLTSLLQSRQRPHPLA